MVDKKMTAIASSVGADERQSTSKNIIDIIPNNMGKGNLQAVKTLENGGFKDLATKTLTELYDTVYPQKKSIVDGLLYSGVYLFVGAPKVGKSFFMAQLGYHISSGIPLWGEKFIRGRFYTWHWKMITQDCSIDYRLCLEQIVMTTSIWQRDQRL